MAFLDNSGDIILDAVLTDAGRFRLAQGDGTFNIAKFALADDEINYTLYNKNHPSGSAYYDLDILQTPIFEAFTNNMSSMKSTLISYSATNLLYLPTMKVVDEEAGNCFPASGPLNSITNTLISTTSGTLHILADTDTNTRFTTVGIQATNALYFNTSGRGIRVDQGLDTIELSILSTLDPTLKESSFIIEVDNRLCSIAEVNLGVANPAFIDDDNKATYIVNINFSYEIGTPTAATDAAFNVIAGPQGQGLIFNIIPSIELQSSTYLFTRLGSTVSNVETATPEATKSFYYIDSYVNVIGATTGTRLSIPVRFIKHAT